jgi:DNA (cytosine-5)-methyltransferase 1
MRGRHVDLLWASPDCKHHSRAKNGKPREKGIRALAWVVVEWAAKVRPTVILLENVPEFATWGPLDDDGRIVKERSGETFRAFTGRLTALGYAVDWKVLNAADHGAPTSRKRLFLVARRDGQPITWPEPTHGPGRAMPWRAAAECIDWSFPIPSIFERKRPLALATRRRIAEGVRRYVLTSRKPFLVNLTHGCRLEGDIDAPIKTITCAHRGEKALVGPVIVRTDMHLSHSRCVYEMGDPLRTITSAGGFGIAAPVFTPWMVETGNGEREGQRPRTKDIQDPMWATTATGFQGALVAAFLAQHNGGPHGGAVGRDLGSPMQTIMGVNNKGAVAVFLDKLHGSARAGQPIDAPLGTITSGGGRGGGHAALVAAFLAEFHGPDIAGLKDGLVTLEIEGATWAMVDIGMRMLQPRELARAQGFPDSYILTGNKSQQVARIGNSVCPPVARAVAEAAIGRAQGRVA